MTEELQLTESAAAKEATLRTAIADRPGSVQLLVQLVTCLRQQGKLSDALEALEIGVPLASGHIRLVTLQAHILVEMGRNHDAAKAAAMAVEMTPGSIELRLLSCRMHLANLQPAQAQQQLDAAMELDPEHRQLLKMKTMQQRINSMSRTMESRPLDWLLRKFNRRIANVAGKKEERN